MSLPETPVEAAAAVEVVATSPCPAALDVRAIRAQFPLLAQQDAQENSLVYLDNAATTHKPECVLQAHDLFYRHHNANPLRAVYPLGVQATRLYDDARRTVAQFLSCDTDEVVFTSGATEALNTVAFMYGAKVLDEGDEVVLPLSEHHANLLPWQVVCRLSGAQLVAVVPDEQGCFSEQAWRRAVSPRTKIIALSQVSNVLGGVADLERIVRMARVVGAQVVLDCAQSAAHMPLDVRALDIDFAVCSGHKMYAPMGIGVLYAKGSLLKEMAPLLRGGGMTDAVFERRATFVDPPMRFEAGTPNVAGALGLAQAIRFIDQVGFDAIGAHEQRLCTRLLVGLQAIPSVVVYGQTLTHADACSQRSGVVSFAVKGVSAHDVAKVLARDNIALRSGTHCAEPLIRYLGQRALCRASLALYNTEDDVDRFLEVLEDAPRAVSAMMTAGLR